MPAAMTRDRLEEIVREEISRAVANALTSGVPSSGMLNRAAGAIMRAADEYEEPESDTCGCLCSNCSGCLGW